MIEFLTEYGLFLAKSATVVLFLLLMLKVIFMLFAQAKSGGDEHLEVHKLNEKFERMKLSLNTAILPKKAFKQALKAQQKQQQQAANDSHRKRVYVIEFKGDVLASDVASLRESITAILTVAKAPDEVVVLLESSGGTVHGYGLAASQLQRIRDKDIKLTVAVDKVAASGGYMMACVADHIIAAPFAVIGSIGVISQIPNFNRLLKNHDIDFELMTSGDYKRTLTLFGENTDAGRQKAQQETEETHQLFKDFVKENRPDMDIATISTGEHWYGLRALQLKLVDELRTSDDYLLASAQNADLFQLTYTHRKRLIERLFSSAKLGLINNTLS